MLVSASVLASRQSHSPVPSELSVVREKRNLAWRRLSSTQPLRTKHRAQGQEEKHGLHCVEPNRGRHQVGEREQKGELAPKHEEQRAAGGERAAEPIRSSRSLGASAHFEADRGDAAHNVGPMCTAANATRSSRVGLLPARLGGAARYAVARCSA